MRRAASLLVVVLAGLLCPVSSSELPAPKAAKPSGALSGTAVYVYDGDTIKVRLASGEDIHVRLIGVDSPELDDAAEGVRFSAFLAQRYVRWKLFGRSVRLTRDAQPTDAYGRLLAYVWTDEPLMFNEILLREGYARAYLKYPFDEARMRLFRADEAGARLAGKGMWRTQPLPVVGPEAAWRRLGEVAAVRYLCRRTFNRGRFRILPSTAGGFEAVIPRDVLEALPDSLDFQNRVIEVSGFLEGHEGRPQIMVGVPLQIRAVSGS